MVEELPWREEQPCHPTARALAEAAGAFVVSEEIDHRVGESIEVTGVDEKPALAVHHLVLDACRVSKLAS